MYISLVTIFVIFVLYLFRHDIVTLIYWATQLIIYLAKNTYKYLGYIIAYLAFMALLVQIP